MNDLVEPFAAERDALARSATLARLYGQLDDLEATLDRIPLWEPARELGAEVGWVRGQLGRLAESWERRLLVAIVGPSGAGKSTLINALARRSISAVGLERPTTRQVVAFAPTQDDARWLEQLLGEDDVVVEVEPEAPGLANLVLLDTPDTNTVPENQALLARTLEHVDLVLAVFDAGNPRLLDNLSFLAPAMKRLPPNAIVPVLNRIDRVTEEALDRELVPDLAEALRSEWGLAARRIYQISAREASRAGEAVDDEHPLHGRNEFRELEGVVLQSFGRRGQAAAYRGAHAERLVALLQSDVAARVGEAGSRVEARARLQDLERQTRQAMAGQVLGHLERGAASSLAEGLYERLARRWWGPVGWLIALWALALRAIGWLRQATRRGQPAELVRLAAAGGGERSLDRGVRQEVLAAQNALYAAAWPPLGDLLVQAGFGPRVRQSAYWREHAEATASAVYGAGQATIEGVLDGLARRLSLWLWQLLLNGPVIALASWVGIQAVAGLFLERYLGGDYFRQAAIAAGVLWFGGFVVIQVSAGAMLRRPLERALERALAEVAAGEAGDLMPQLEALEDLSRMTARRHR
ncbi:MAG: ATP-binding cassette domain-containing protein [Chloroflexi bacterium]|nr:ATP-binding cassette domain-containing protein [Chloroflexota bacterium]